IAHDEEGIYFDPIAWALRGQPRPKIRAVLDHVIPMTAKSESREALLRIIDGQALAGAEIGLVYGIHRDMQKKQFVHYLEGLASLADRTDRSFVLISPLEFAHGDIERQDVATQVTVLAAGDPLPAAASPGMIYIVKTGSLPLPVFVGLMAYSQIPPVVAGDGA